MNDYCLWAATEQEMASKLPWLRFTGDNGVELWLGSSKDHTLVAGVMVKVEDEQVDSDGAVIKDAVYADGFHLNLRMSDSAENTPPSELVIYPNSPSHTFG